MKPTIGRIVVYRESDAEVGAGSGHNGTRMHPAMITRVWTDTCVNLHVFFDAHPSLVRTSVNELVNLGYGVHNPNSGWYWPPRDDNLPALTDRQAIGEKRLPPTEAEDEVLAKFCNCTAASPCPLGRIGQQPRCTNRELRRAVADGRISVNAERQAMGLPPITVDQSIPLQLYAAKEDTDAELNDGGPVSINAVEEYIRNLSWSDTDPGEQGLVAGNLRAFATSVRMAFMIALEQAEAMRNAIGAIWKADIYEGRKKENGISVDMVSAIRHAAATTGFPMSERLPSNPAAGSHSYALRRDGDYVVLVVGASSLSMLGSEVVKLVSHLQRVAGTVGPVLMSGDNSNGWKLEELAQQLIRELGMKDNVLRTRASSSPVQSVILSNNRQIRALLRSIRQLQENTLSALNAIGPDEGPTGKPRV